jgi:isopentenyl-diphosphate delta-isomerase type 1
MEFVVLVDEQNTVLGTHDKNDVHTDHTPLHRGFSFFLFNSKHELLLTRRALTKKTFPGVWTNTVCGHPAPDEQVVDAAKRRLQDEMGITNIDIKEVSPYRYRFADASGIVENEICPILVGFGDVTPKINEQEVASWKWIGWQEFLRDIEIHPELYSPWSREEAKIIDSRHILNG